MEVHVARLEYGDRLTFPFGHRVPSTYVLRGKAYRLAESESLVAPRVHAAAVDTLGARVDSPGGGAATE